MCARLGARRARLREGGHAAGVPSDDLDTAPVYLMVAESFILSFQGTSEVLRLDRILQRMLSIAAVRSPRRS